MWGSAVLSALPEKRNYLELDLDFLTALKKKKEGYKKFDDNDVFSISDSSRTYVATSNSGQDTLRQYSIFGNPALSRIQYFVVGVRNKNNIKPITGEVWIDELRLSGVRKDVGSVLKESTIFQNNPKRDLKFLKQSKWSAVPNERAPQLQPRCLKPLVRCRPS